MDNSCGVQVSKVLLVVKLTEAQIIIKPVQKLQNMSFDGLFCHITGRKVENEGQVFGSASFVMIP